MAAFSFRLQTVLDYRSSLVDRLRADLATVEAHIARETGQVTILRDTEATLLQTLGEVQRTAPRVEELTRLSDLLEFIRGRIDERNEEIRQLQQESGALRDRLVEASKHQRALERLRERQAGEFQTAANRLEQHETNELAAMFHRRQPGT